MPLPDLSSMLMEPIKVQNQEPNKTVFTKAVNGESLRLIFGAFGQDDDTQRVPIGLANDIDFLNSLEQGVLKVVAGPPELVEALQFQADNNRREAQAKMDAKHTETMDRRQDRDMIGVTCIGPAPAGRNGECGAALIQSSKQATSAPPLCPRHADQAPMYHLVQTGSKGEGATETTAGKVETQWKRVVMTAPVKE